MVFHEIKIMLTVGIKPWKEKLMFNAFCSLIAAKKFVVVVVV